MSCRVPCVAQLLQISPRLQKVKQGGHGLKLLAKLREKDHWTTVEAQHPIQSHFGVVYGQDQVRRILKSFGMYYGKPYPRDSRRPADATVLLKKNSRG